MTFVHPFDDPLVIAGQGTVGDEILRHRLGDVAAIFVPVGGGGLIAGIGSYVKALRPSVRVIGVEPFGADAMYQSLAAGPPRHARRGRHLRRRRRGPRGGCHHVSRSCRRPSMRSSGSRTTKSAPAIKDIFDDTRTIMEPAGALARRRSARMGRVEPASRGPGLPPC